MSKQQMEIMEMVAAGKVYLTEEGRKMIEQLQSKKI